MDSKLIVKDCEYFRKTASKYLQVPAIADSLAEFIATKQANPIAPYGSSDKSNPVGTPMTKYIPKIRHAHLNQDVSVFYTVSGNPTELKLYAILSHSEAGTGQPTNPKKQTSVAKKLKNQNFN
jgi:mRNA-degrading endonuclease YafQ of YafQ-DinJ toxin-antitoxin module